MGATRIEWADRVWNPVTGCSPVSAGCDNCYAKRMAQRLRGRAGYPADDPFRVTVHPERLDEPLRWRKAARVFVCSMGDLFHPAVSVEVLKLIWTTMECTRRTFVVLTKRPERMRNLLSESGHLARQHALPNVWLGVSVEDQATADERIPILLQTPAALRFVSVEPMLGPVDLASYMHPAHWHWDSRYGTPEAALAAGARAERRPQALVLADARFVNWVICGGETGAGARLMHPEWARSLRDQCQAAGVPFFLKAVSRNAGRELDGRTWDEFPEDAGAAAKPGPVAAFRRPTEPFGEGRGMQ